MIFHLHIPKTGGSSLITLLEKEYKDEYLRVPNWNQSTLPIWSKEWGDPIKVARKECVSGHFFFGFWKALNDELPERAKIHNPQFITFIRDPVDRLLSLYHYWRTNKNRYQPILQDLSFPEFARSKNSEWLILDNGLVRRIAGVKEHEDPVSAKNYDTAISNLQYFPLVGLVERFDETLLRWQELLGWKEIDYKYKLKQPERLRQEELSVEVVKEIKERQKYDYLLYDYVVDKWWS